MIETCRPPSLWWIIAGIPFLLAFCTVFVVSNDLAKGVVSGKYFWFYGSMALIALYTASFVWFSKTKYRFSTTDLLVILFAGSVYFSTLVLNDSAPNITRLTLLTLLVVLYFCFRTLFNEWNKDKYRLYKFFCAFIVLTGLIEAIIGLRQLYGFDVSYHGVFKVTGTFFNPGPYAGYLAVVFPLALNCFLSKNNVLLKGLGSISCIAILLVLPVAMSRASWLAAIAGSLVILNFRPSLICKGGTKDKNLWLIILSLFLTAIFLLSIYHLKKDSADGRLLTWKVSLQAVAKHPFGVGLGNFSGAYGVEQAAYFASGSASEQEEYVAGNPEYGFNEYLQILIESGIVSFLLFAGIMTSAACSMWRNNEKGKLGALIALLIFAFFSYPFSVLPFPILLVFLLASQTGNTDNTDLRGVAVSHGSKRRFPFIKVLIVYLCLLLSVFCIWKQYPVYQAYKQWKNAQNYYQAGLFGNTTITNYELLYPYLNDQIQFLFEYAQCLSKTGLNDKEGISSQARYDKLVKSNEILQRATQISCDPMLYNIMGKNSQALRQYEQAEVFFIKSTNLVPNRLYPWYLLCKLQAEMGQLEKAAKTAEIVLKKEPKVQSSAINEMREEVRKLKLSN